MLLNIRLLIKSGGIMTNFYERFFDFWERYNGIALLSIILGIICCAFPWFQKYNPYWINKPLEELYLIEFFYYDIHTALFGLLFLFGFSFLIFYYVGIVLKNRGTYGTPFETHAKKFFKLSVILLVAFEVLAFIHFISPPDLNDIWFSWFRDWIFVENWRIDVGFFIGIFMISGVISSFIYDKFMLRRHYRRHLPEFDPNPTQSVSRYSRLGFFIMIGGLIGLVCLMLFTMRLVLGS